MPSRLAVAALVGVVFGVSCNLSNGPSSSSTTLTGDWSGVLQYTVNGTSGQQNVTMSLQQSESAVTGTYSVTSAGFYASGNRAVTGTVTTDAFSGMINFEPSSNPTSCAGTASFSGNGTGNTLTWTSSGYSATCPIIPTTTTIIATRQ
ncbi:MAG TPA: hypothetical protein VH583_02635 [Vicinamibacterales bacterium]|jgi:hypothetical protein